MKKIALFFVSVLAFTGVASADDKPITFEQLPAKAQQFIKTNFAQEKIAITTKDVDIFGDSYDVLFASGTKLEFTDKGEWKEIECKYGEVPTEIVPRPIRDCVSTRFAQRRIISLDRDRRGYDVELDNGLDLEFDSSFRLVDIDD